VAGSNHPHCLEFEPRSPSANAHRKAELLEEARSRSIAWEQQKEIDGSQKVRVWGDTAVVTAKLWVKGSPGGKPFDGKL
jgi:hypothetical protein